MPAIIAMKHTDTASAAAKPTSQTFRVGLIGAGIQASRTPRLHEQEARAADLPYSYHLLDLEQIGIGVEALPQLLDTAQGQGFAGLNITHPCKQKIIPLYMNASPIP